jgi:hypothetical protein
VCCECRSCARESENRCDGLARPLTDEEAVRRLHGTHSADRETVVHPQGFNGPSSEPAAPPPLPRLRERHPWTVLVAVYGQFRLTVDNAGSSASGAVVHRRATDRAEDSSARTAGAARTVCSVPRNRPWELEALEHETSSWDSKAGPVRPRRPRQLRDCQDHDGRYRGGHRRDGAAPYWSEPSHQSSVTDFAHGSLTSAPGRGPACSQDSCVRLLRPATRRSRTRERVCIPAEAVEAIQACE